MLFLGAIIVSSTDSHVKIITAMLESDLLNLIKVDFRNYHILEIGLYTEHAKAIQLRYYDNNG